MRSFAVIEPPSRDCINELQEACGNNLFFFVSEVQEIQRLLNDNVKVVDAKGDTSWKAVFDTAHQSVLSEDVPDEDADRAKSRSLDGDDEEAEASLLEGRAEE